MRALLSTVDFFESQGPVRLYRRRFGRLRCRGRVDLVEAQRCVRVGGSGCFESGARTVVSGASGMSSLTVDERVRPGGLGGCLGAAAGSSSSTTTPAAKTLSVHGRRREQHTHAQKQRGPHRRSHVHARSCCQQYSLFTD